MLVKTDLIMTVKINKRKLSDLSVYNQVKDQDIVCRWLYIFDV